MLGPKYGSGDKKTDHMVFSRKTFMMQTDQQSGSHLTHYNQHSRRSDQSANVKPGWTEGTQSIKIKCSCGPPRHYWDTTPNAAFTGTQQKKPQTLQPPAAPAKLSADMRTRPPQRREDCKDRTFRLAARLEWSAEGNGRILTLEETWSTQLPSLLLSHTCNLGMSVRACVRARAHTHTQSLC